MGKELTPDPDFDPDYPMGEFPPGNIPGSIFVEKISGGDLQQKTSGFLETHPHILPFAKEQGKRLVALHKNGKVILVEAATAALTLAVGAIVLYEHHKKENK